MATASNEIDEIRRRMAEIRRELHQDVREVVASAEAVTDWRRYIRMYPWGALGAAFTVGYLIVPNRHRTVPPDVATQADVAEVREAVVGTQEKTKKGVFAAAWGLMAPIGVRAAQSYAIQFIENWMQQQAAAGPPPHQPSAPGGPRPGRTSGPCD